MRTQQRNRTLIIGAILLSLAWYVRSINQQVSLSLGIGGLIAIGYALIALRPGAPVRQAPKNPAFRLAFVLVVVCATTIYLWNLDRTVALAIGTGGLLGVGYGFVKLQNI